MKNFLFIIVLFFSSTSLFADCDSVQVTLSFTEGDCDDSKSKSVKHFSQSGKLLFTEYYTQGYPNYIWKPSTREYFNYDANDSLINHTYQNPKGNGWIDFRRLLFSYNSFGSVTSSTQQNFIANVWQTIAIDSNTYDAQNNRLSNSHFAPGPIAKMIFINTASDTAVIIQHGDSSGAWINFSKHEIFFNGFQLIQEIFSQWINNVWVGTSRTDFSNINSTKVVTFFSWVNNVWTPSSKTVNYYTGNQLDSTSSYNWTNSMWIANARTLYFYNSGLNDSIITQNMDTVWINQTLIVNLYTGSNLYQVYKMHWVDTAWVFDELTTHDYDVNGRVIRDYYQSWQDTSWINVSSSIFEYGFLNRIVRAYYLTGNDTGWVYESQNVNEIDQNGYPTYQDELYAYDYWGAVNWQSVYGPSYTIYSATGLLLSRSGYNVPGGPYSANYNYLDGFLIEGHSNSETMGGLTCDNDSYGYLADVNGDSIFCAGGFTTLYADSCHSYQYLWSTGATTASIQVATEGEYYVTVKHQSGISYESPTIRVKIVGHLPYMPMGPDSNITVCGNRFLQINLPNQNGVSYQWYRNDTALLNYTSSSTTFYGFNLIAGEYYLCATNACGTDTSASSFVQIIPYPSDPTITPNGNLIVCPGDTLQLAASLGTAYSWYPGGQTTQSISVYNSGHYRVQVFDSTGCSAYSEEAHVTRSYSTSIPTIVLQNGNLQTYYGGTHQWFLNGDSILGANQSFLTPNLPGNYTLAVADYLNCVKLTNSIYINPNVLNVSIPHIKYICDGGTVQLGLSSPVAGGIPPYYYYWSTNNQTFLPGSSVYSISNLTADQTYYLKVRDSLGNIAVDSVQVIVDRPIKPLFAPLNNCNVGYNPIRILNYSSNYSIQKWFVDGITMTYPGFAYFSGIYQVLINNEHDCPVWSDPDTIYLDTPPSPLLINATLDQDACINGSGTLWVNSTPGYTYEWSRYSNLTVGTDTLLYVNYPVRYELQVTDTNGCSGSSSFDFNLDDEKIEMEILSDHYSMCDVDSVEFRVSIITGWTYEWYDSDNNLLDTGTTLNVNIQGGYTCLATSPTGCTASATAYFSHYQSPVITIIDSGGVLYAASRSYTSYQWFRNGVEIPGAMNRFFVPVNSGEYHVRMHNIGSGSSCPGYSNTIYIGVCSVSVSNSSTCSNQCSGQLIATGSGTGTLNYSWSNGNTLNALNNLCQGIYIVTITDSVGCVARDTVEVVSDSVSFSIINLDPNCNGCANGRIMIQGDFSSVTWQPNNGTLIGNTIFYLTAGIYNICVTDSNQCIQCVSDTLVEPPLGIKNISSDILSYYPNPVSEKITISGILENELFDVVIFDKTGRQVDSYHTISKTFDVSKYASGIYSIEFRSVKLLYRLIFIKN